MEFNLIDEPWLPVLGYSKPNVGIAEALCGAHKIDELRDPSPLVTVALHRLLVVILRDALGGPKNLKEWARLWKKGEFPQKKLKDYFKKKRDRFDLFDPKRPFFQSAKAAGQKTMDVTELFQHCSTGTNISHFSHDHEGEHAACPKCCACGLVMLPAFCTQGGAGKAPSINNAPPVYALVRGSSLCETLMLNQAVPGVASPAAQKDTPAWEGATKGRGPIGFMEGLTWQPRTVLLIPEECYDGACTICGAQTGVAATQIVFAKGRRRSDPTERDRDWVDPHVPLIKSGKTTKPLKPPHPLKARWKHPAFWRALFRAAFINDEAEAGVPIVRQLVRAAGEGKFDVDSRLYFDFVGLHSAQAKLMLSHEWSWRMTPADLCKEPRRAGWDEMLDLTQALVDQIVKNTRGLEAKARAVRAFERKAERVFAMHVGDPGRLPTGDAASLLRKAAEEAFRHALPAQGAYSARKGKANVQDRLRCFRYGAAKAVGEGGDRK